ncbi:MAG: retropepsin-like domain-containing protein [Prolixibacteraceae bacterium]|jgi:predicted aspartyl protease|nr:retropepsin-like domain-containing protein [Prolixibacteraceae bacterium]
MSNKTSITLFLLLVFTFPLLVASPLSTANKNFTSISGLPSPVVASLFQTISYTPENDQKIDSVIIPLKRAGRLLLVEANVDGETGNLVFDTGANGLVFNSTYFRNHVRSDVSGSNGITGSVGNVEHITIDKIEFANLTYKKVRADLTNLGHIENSKGIKILGLFGFNMIRDFEIILDTKGNQLKLYRIDKTGNRIVNDQYKFRPDYSQLFKTNSNILYLTGKIGGKTLNFCLDTGAETNVINSYSGKNILSTLTITRRSSLRGAGSSRSEVLFGRMNDFTLGSKPINGMETVISNLEALSEAYGTKIDGMLGFNFMEQGIVCINFVKRQFGIQFTKGDVK